MPETTRDTRRWWQRPNRILLLNLREGDEPKIDAEAMVRDAKSYGATAFCVSGGGIVAFYKTDVPHHAPSRALGDRDLLAEIVPVAHREGIKVLARIDSSCARKELAEEHPEWFTRTAAGEFCEVSGHYVTCPNGGYYHGRMVEIVREADRIFKPPFSLSATVSPVLQGVNRKGLAENFARSMIV